MKKKWNDKYNTPEYIFDKVPNYFLKEEIEKIKPGKALFIGEGEGRNSVYAATLGWEIDAIDISDVAKNKAEKLAEENNVQINYFVEDALNYNYPKEKYDLVAIIYFHVSEELRNAFNKNITEALKPGGKLILLVYDKEHLTKGMNGPSNIDVLYTLQQIAEDFINFDFEVFKKETLTRVKKGVEQKSVVIKFVGTKI